MLQWKMDIILHRSFDVLACVLFVSLRYFEYPIRYIFSPRNWIFSMFASSLASSIVFLTVFCDLVSLLPSVNCPLFKLLLDLLWPEVFFWLRLLQFPRDHLVTYRSIWIITISVLSVRSRRIRVKCYVCTHTDTDCIHT